MLESPLSQQDQILQFIRSLNSRQLATRVKFDMTLLEAIKAVQTRATKPFSHDHVTPRNLGQSSRRLTAVLNELNLDKEEGNGDDEDLYYDAKEEDEENTLNAIRRAISQGNHGGRGDRTGGVHGSNRSSKEQQLQVAHDRQVQTTINDEAKFARTQKLTSRQATAARSRGYVMTPQQLEWFRNRRCITCGQEGHVKRDCSSRSQCKCFTCGKEGHCKQECLAKPSTTHMGGWGRHFPLLGKPSDLRIDLRIKSPTLRSICRRHK
jgi:hypothetical protein